MSLQLTLVFNPYDRHDTILAYNRLTLHHNVRADFDALRAMAQPLNGSIDWYGDEGIEEKSTDPYGDPLTFTTALNVYRCLKGMDLRGWDFAVREFVGALPLTSIVVLYWC